MGVALRDGLMLRGVLGRVGVTRLIADERFGADGRRPIERDVGRLAERSGVRMVEGRVMLRDGARLVGVDGRRMIEREGVDRRLERDGACRAELPRDRLVLRGVARRLVALRRDGALRR